MIYVHSPVPGTAMGLSEVFDPVFSQGMVGPGAAVTPVRDPHEAVAPVGGAVVKLHPHAFVVVDGQGRGVLVHLGIDTVRLGGAGFERLVEEGEQVPLGAPLVRWNPAEIEARGYSPIVPVVALDADGDVISRSVTGEVAQGELLFQWA